MTSSVLPTILEKRIATFSKVISLIFMIFGVGAAVAQILKISPLLESYPGWDWNLSNILALILGIVLFIVGKRTTVTKAVYYSLFSRKETMKRFLFSLPISATLLVIVIVKLILGKDNPSYIKIMGEGGFVEYGTAIAYILAFSFSVPIANYFLKRGQKQLSIFYYLLSIFLIFIGLEEISWGQGIIGWGLPDFFQSYNVQEETTIHNLVWFHYHSRDAIILVSLVGSIGWLVSFCKQNPKFNQFSKFLFPDWFLSSFFIVSLIVSILLKFQDTLVFFIPKDQEFAELILSLGFLLFVVINYFRQSLKFREE
ncbi:MAG: hypothetical protein F6K14_26435 [Symploca sp. SIO2C1]|nr:hypothetical protein [Symploca sp. SIO2C1]